MSTFTNRVVEEILLHGPVTVLYSDLLASRKNLWLPGEGAEFIWIQELIANGCKDSLATQKLTVQHPQPLSHHFPLQANCRDCLVGGNLDQHVWKTISTTTTTTTTIVVWSKMSHMSVLLHVALHGMSVSSVCNMAEAQLIKQVIH